MLSDCPGLMQTHLLLPTKIITTIAQTMTVASYYLETYRNGKYNMGLL